MLCYKKLNQTVIYNCPTGNSLKESKYLMNWNILVVKRKEINRDFASSGERKWIR